jgi:hypothetical protein
MLVLFASKTDMAACAAELVGICLSRVPSPRILFPTGTTPLGPDAFFDKLIQRRVGGAGGAGGAGAGAGAGAASGDATRLDLHRVRLVGGDEYCGPAKDEEGAFAGYTRKHVIEPMGMDLAKCLLLNGAAEDIEAECNAFDADIRRDPLQLAVCGG